MLEKKQIISLMIAFMLGIIVNETYAGFGYLEMPLSQLRTAPELNSPTDWIKEDQINVYSNRVVIEIKDPEWASFTNTNSMDPVIDETSHAIQIVPKSKEDISVGDIISYKSDYAEGIIIHRVIKIGEDERGWYCIVKGDNNPTQDPGKIRFSQITRILVAIIY
ncbi:MAG: hypothetical protein PHV16_03735 [Candidatus Nanoarchaeia archaeon]|nr:hypothetical protein [Candidatus Nanoarchaeia archaeon]